MNMEMETFTYTCLALIVIAFIAAFIVVQVYAKKGKLIEKRRWIEQLPSIISTLGVLGTFAGITVGLVHFNPHELTNSIPDLLEGLKTAFFTSLAGMVGSVILSKVVADAYDKVDKGVSDINVAAGQITKAVEAMSKAIIENTNRQAQVQAAFNNTVSTSLQTLVSEIQSQGGSLQQLLTVNTSVSVDMQALKASISSMLEQINSLEDHVKSMDTGQDIIVSRIETLTDKLNGIAEDIDTISGDVTDTLTHTAELREDTIAINKKMDVAAEKSGELLSMVEGMASCQSGIEDEVKSFGEKLHNEVVEIEDKMEGTNKLLDAKFAEFTELLKKSNTEALVEVMKKVTEEFQKQMKDLIGRLVKENFDQLNKSVERLNTWQIENKEMISSLTKQYKEMASSFEQTSTVLSDVGKETKSLVSEEGKLQKIVAALNAVMVQDQKFIEITTNLTQSAELNKQSMIEFKDAQATLNEWVRKQRNFVDAVQALMNQLQDIAKINDYSETFWQQTKQGMNESVGIIKRGSDSLEAQISSLDASFYNRLSQTLAELDNCIQKMVEHYES